MQYYILRGGSIVSAVYSRLSGDELIEKFEDAYPSDQFTFKREDELSLDVLRTYEYWNKRP